MSKIIIHNLHPDVSDAIAVKMVAEVVDGGFVSGKNQYCWLTHWRSYGAVVCAMISRGDTHTFKVVKDD